MLIATIIGSYICSIVFASSFFAKMGDDVVFGNSPEYLAKGIFWPLVIPMSFVARLGSKTAEKLKAPKIPEAKLLND